MYVLNALTVSMASAVVDAFRGAGGEGDDDKDKDFAERWFAHTKSNFADNANPVALLPYAKDVLSLIQGYDVDRMDLAGMTRLLRAVESWEKLINGESTRSKYYVLKQTADAVSSITGIPAKNIMRDSEAIAKGLSELFGDELYAKYLNYRTLYIMDPDAYHKNKYIDLYYDATAAGDQKLANHIKKEMIAAGYTTEQISKRKRQWQKNKTEAAESEKQ